MISHTTERFRKAFAELPQPIQQAALNAYRLWKQNPFHPSLRFKQIHSKEPIYSVRIGIGWRTICRKERNTAIWFWIGSHSEYNDLISRL